MLAVLIYIADFVLVFVLVVMFRQIYKSFRSQLAPMYNSKLAATAELPSVTVCIPARNENHALADCLQQVLASTYEKLEIIVLDDMSGDNTSALIKSFASEGVRFVQGSELPKGWLGKNYALQGLLNEASGRYILFIDVDTVLQPNAIEHMVRYAVNHRAAMVSVLPRREDSWRVSVFGSPLRYFWELMFQRRLSPASSSYAWIIRRDILLKKFDGFNALKNTAQPEAKIAAELSAVKQYRFLVGTKKFGISFQKKWRSQLISSVRLLYPALGKQLPLAILV
jgi:cellulose synthase/poly-beta-1,6-N-acetylglucosamine synthase-like glycosyltransferase